MNVSKLAMTSVVACLVAMGSATAAHAKAKCIQSSGLVNMIFPKFKQPKAGKLRAAFRTHDYWPACRGNDLP